MNWPRKHERQRIVPFPRLAFKQRRRGLAWAYTRDRNKFSLQTFSEHGRLASPAFYASSSATRSNVSLVGDYVCEMVAQISPSWGSGILFETLGVGMGERAYENISESGLKRETIA
ncbi:hypothetical protein CPC08DRAFT_723789 [Agrocybe pediades]|nr:hypothetical protein CPC08DRAFT_723789 [Agrocybe pediades]